MTATDTARRVALCAGVITALIAGGVAAQAPPASADSITPALVALGDSVYHGRVGGGTCFACHGARGAGGLTPPLTTGPWLHADSSYESILRIVREGVLRPKQAPTPMPPMGGANLTPQHLRAVAAYVYTLSRPRSQAAP